MSLNVVFNKVELHRLARILLDVANSYITILAARAALHLFLFFYIKQKQIFSNYCMHEMRNLG